MIQKVKTHSKEENMNQKNAQKASNINDSKGRNFFLII